MSSESKATTAATLRASSPNVLFVISRSKNLNIVVYEANMKDGQLNPDDPVSVYWLELDPEYQKKNRANGINTDRSELNTLEKRFAYGLSFKSVDSPDSHVQQFSVSLVAFKERAVVVSFDRKTKALKCQMEINKKMCDIEGIYINATDRMIGLPKVNYVELNGTNEEGKQTEKIIPK